MVVKTSFKTIDVDKGFDKSIAGLKSFDGDYVQIGYQGIEGNQKHDKDSPQTITDIAIANEFGTKTIPSRPFMRNTYTKNLKDLNALIVQQINLVTAGKNEKRALEQLGSWYQGRIIDTIKDDKFTPNSPLTIKIKKSSKPLIDTGRMWQSITYVVKS